MTAWGQGFANALLVASLWWPATVFASGTQALFDLTTPDTAPFPTNRYTVRDPSQITGLRVNLPLPSDCAHQGSLCNHLNLLNELDGFNIQPRLSIPFSGPINPGSVSSNSVFLVEVSARAEGANHEEGVDRNGDHDDRAGGRVIGINQVVWDPDSNTLHVQSDTQLKQHSVYALIVTDGVTDPAGVPVAPAKAFARLLDSEPDGDRYGDNGGGGGDPQTMRYLRELRGTIHKLFPRMLRERIVAVSVFTTMTVTEPLEKIRHIIRDAPPPAPADFQFMDTGTQRLVFPTGGGFPLITANVQLTGAPLTNTFYTKDCPLHFPGPEENVASVVAFGKYSAPGFLTPQNFLPQVGTRTGSLAVVDQHDLIFILFLPAGTPPSGGWPVAIYGHGLNVGKLDSCPLHNELNAAGIAVIAISAVGHDGGAQGYFTVQTATENFTFSFGGRGVDQNGDGKIGTTEGMGAIRPYGLVGIRDGDRQTVADLMQLVRVIEVGMDVDGDGVPDLNPERIYYFGQSNGGNYGALLLAVEPKIRAGVLIVPGANMTQPVSPLSYPNVAQGLFFENYTPSLINQPATLTTPNGGFDANIPLRNQPPVINRVPGAMALQTYFDRQDWANQPGSSTAYAPYLRPHPPARCPPADCPPNRILLQFAKGDQNVPNPLTTRTIRAGHLEDLSTYLHWDLVKAIVPSAPCNPHNFILIPYPLPYPFSYPQPPAYPQLQPARQQIATFFASDGATIIDPDGPGPLFETPIVPPLPETPNYLCQ